MACGTLTQEQRDAMTAKAVADGKSRAALLVGDEKELYQSLLLALTVKNEVDRDVAIKRAVSVLNSGLPSCWQKLAVLYSLAYDYNKYRDTEDFDYFGDGQELVGLAQAEFDRLFRKIADRK